MERYRPILRMHDLQYYPSQNQRLKAQAKQDEAIGQYTTYSKLWAPTNHQALFMTKVPRSVTRLSEEVYFVLMQQRVNWLIQQWMEEVNDSLEQTQEFLVNHWQRLGMSSDYPLVDFELDFEQDYGLMQWREAWSDVFITGNEQFSLLLAHQQIHFPVDTLSKNHPAYADLLDRHQDIYLEEWLTLLVG
ncbi:hypothetical protein [Pantanalinema sp. GBBB05]|uniref:hypothetical protein n=1 Tax=Pantanalinema sp. GBBB05 TaxID=2604139 RepID=UPI001D80843E|nr:hypothetical protein [Pantanalinema sp. GBBB05]